MDTTIRSVVTPNSAEYFTETLITDNGFREYDVRWLLEKEINPNGFLLLGRAFGTYIRESLGETSVVVGHDFRQYSQDLCRSFVVGILSSGIDVIDIGLTLTPILYFAQYHFGFKCGAMITASHNENGWTGVKLADGFSSTLGPDGIQRFKKTLKDGKFIDGKGYYRQQNIFDAYLKNATQNIKLSSPIDVVLAAGNGTAGIFAPAVLRAIGCNIIEVDCTPDWNFPNFNPNPEDVSFLKSIGGATRSHNAKIGIGIDGDGDRIGVVDDQGEEVYSDKMGLLVARWISKEFPARKIIVDVKSTGLYFTDKILSEANMEVVLAKTGHSYVKAAVTEHDAIAGFERSGHWFFNAPYGQRYDDAIVASVQVLRMLDQSNLSLSELVASLPHTWQSPTMGVYCNDAEKYEVVDCVTEQYEMDKKNGAKIAGEAIKSIVTVNGVRFMLESGGWGLVRASSNKPSLVVVAESPNSEDELYSIVNHIKARLAATGRIGDYDQVLPQREADAK